MQSRLIRRWFRSILLKVGLYKPVTHWNLRWRLQKEASRAGFGLMWSKTAIGISRMDQSQQIVIAIRHLAYAWDIMNDFDRYFEAVEPERRGTIQVVDYSKPQIHRLKPSGIAWWFTSFAENLPLLEKEYFYGYRPKEGDIVFDCGAYCGDSALLLSNLVGQAGKVYAFEPDADNYAMLIKNLNLHNLTNVVPVPKGVWSSTTTLSFRGDGNLGGMIDAGQSVQPQSKLIEVTSIPDACREFGLSKLDFVKMDIEGAEVEAIHGASDFLNERNTHLAIANHVRNDGAQTHSIVAAILRKIGYTVETISPSGNQTWSGLITYAQKGS